jgi:hypothetical protein
MLDRGFRNEIDAENDPTKGGKQSKSSRAIAFNADKKLVSVVFAKFYLLAISNKRSKIPGI